MSKEFDLNNVEKKIDEKTNFEMLDNKIILKKLKLPPLKIQKIFLFPTSSYCYFFISFGLFILGCEATGWCKYGSTFLNSVFLFLGFGQYIIGIYDWNQGNILLSTQNIIFGIWYMTFFLNNFEINGLKKSKTNYSNIQGISNLILLFFVAVNILMIKGKGILYLIDYFLLFFSHAFLALCGYSYDEKIIIKVTGYVLFINSIFFWLTGLSLVINDVFNKKIISLVEPKIQ